MTTHFSKFSGLQEVVRILVESLQVCTSYDTYRNLQMPELCRMFLRKLLIPKKNPWGVKAWTRSDRSGPIQGWVLVILFVIFVLFSLVLLTASFFRYPFNPARVPTRTFLIVGDKDLVIGGDKRQQGPCKRGNKDLAIAGSKVLAKEATRTLQLEATRTLQLEVTRTLQKRQQGPCDWRQQGPCNWRLQVWVIVILFVIFILLSVVWLTLSIFHYPWDSAKAPTRTFLLFVGEKDLSIFGNKYLSIVGDKDFAKEGKRLLQKRTLRLEATRTLQLEATRTYHSDWRQQGPCNWRQQVRE